MLSEKTRSILENNEIYTSERYEQDGKYYREIEFYSPGGEDVIETIWYDGTDEGFISAFNECADDFDEDEHAEMWINNRHSVGGVPQRIRDLISDAKWIKNKLLEVAAELESGEILSKELKTYKCTISITDGEQIDEQDFYIEANSFDEAVENIKNELNID